jgi:hypothetical protein
MEENKVEYKIDYDVRMGIIINPYFNVRDYGWAMFEGLQATMAERVTSILASDNMFMERIQENMEFTLLPTYRIWLEYVFRGKGVDREEAASFAAGCIKRLAEPLLDAGYGIEKILCYREEFDWP